MDGLQGVRSYQQAEPSHLRSPIEQRRVRLPIVDVPAPSDTAGDGDKLRLVVHLIELKIEDQAVANRLRKPPNGMVKLPRSDM